MAVREFDGTDDRLDCAIGALSGMTHGTAAVIFKPSDVTGTFGLLYLHNSGGTALGFPLTWVNTSIGLHNNLNYSVRDVGLQVTRWYLAVVRKATGNVAARISVYDYTADAWTHGDGTATAVDWSAPGAGGTIRHDFQGIADFCAARIAARAGWSNSLPWSADTTGDTALEAAGLEDALQNWADESPSALWRYNQASVATPVEDLSAGGTADETAIVGTTVVTGDDPPGFDFTLGGAPTRNAFFVRSNLQLA
jgi:hypothetical protein